MRRCTSRGRFCDRSSAAAGVAVAFAFWLPAAPLHAQQAGELVAFKHHLIDAQPPPGPYYKMAGDLDVDGDLDIIVGGRAGPLVMYSNPGWEKSTIAGSGYNGGVNGEIADIDGDGAPDIVMGGVVWFRNPGQGAGGWKPRRIDQQKVHDVEVADLDRDGRLDVVCRDQSAFGGTGNEIFVYYQKAPNSWTKLRRGCPHGEGLKLADVDGDGDADILIGALWYENGGAEWKEHEYARGWTELDCKIETGDINGDGRVDIVVSPSELKGETYKIAWFEAPAAVRSGTWPEHVIVEPIECVIHGLGLGDFNLDGQLDVAYAEMHQGEDPDEVCVMFNDRRGTGWKRQVLSTKGSHDIVVRDMDGDGDPDLFGANHAAVHPLELWEDLHVK